MRQEGHCGKYNSVWKASTARTHMAQCHACKDIERTRQVKHLPPVEGRRLLGECQEAREPGSQSLSIKSPRAEPYVRYELMKGRSHTVEQLTCTLA